MPTKAERYAQMADKVATQLTGSWQEWAGFLTTASRLYKYPFHEQLMLTFEKVLEIFADYLAADETIEVYISRHGCVRVEFDQDFHYCTGEVCHTPKELFDLLADDYRTYVEIELTKGKRELTEDDVKEADALCKRYLDRWKEELE